MRFLEACFYVDWKSMRIVGCIVATMVSHVILLSTLAFWHFALLWATGSLIRPYSVMSACHFVQGLPNLGRGFGL